MSLSGIGEIADLIQDGIDHIWPDKTEQQKIEAEAMMAKISARVELTKAQLEVDKAEAQHPSIFVAGWRPWVGWVCGAAFSWVYVIQPVVSFGFTAAGHPVTLPELDLSQMMPVLLGMLGLGTMRTFERHKGLPTNSKGQG